MNMHTPWQFQNDSSSKMRRDLRQKQKEIANLIALTSLIVVQDILILFWYFSSQGAPY